MASLLRGFATVNQAADGQPSSEQPGLTTEAKEQRAIAAFERALALIQSQRDAEAEAALRTLLEEPVVAEGATDQLQRIKFLVFRNLGDLLARSQGTTSEALDFYSLATQIVENDALLWNKLGTLAAESGYVAAARTAFERGLEVDPQHPTMPDKLLGLLRQAGDAPAAATLATALLRQNPRHAGAAAALAAQQHAGDSDVEAIAGAALLQLPPASMRPGQEVRRPQRSHLERPRTLEQPTWQQLLHHSLLFLTGNKLVEGAAPAAVGGGPLLESKKVPSLVRFNYKKNPPPGQQPQPQLELAGQQQGDGPVTNPAATAAHEPPNPAGVPAPAEHGDQEQQQHQRSLATPATSASPSPAPAAAQGEDASPAAMAIDHSPPAPARLESATPAAPAQLSPAATPVGTGVASSPSAAQVLGSAAASPAAAPIEEGEEERQPHGRASRKVEGRSTRSRAATSAAPLLLGSAAAGGDQEETPDEEALELISVLCSRLSKLQQGAPEAGAPSPLLSSPAKAGPGAAGPGSGGQQGAAAQQHEEAAVKAFIKRLPAQGVSRPELAGVLLSTLGSSSGASQLSPAVRLQLLQVAHHVQHDELALSPEQCLILGELFADAAVAAARALPQPGSVLPAAAVASSAAAAQASRGTTPTAPGLRQPSGLVKRLTSVRGRRTELTLELLQQSCQLWLSRYHLAVSEAAAPVSDEQLRGQVRYWWATGRLLESKADMPAASAAYAHCEDTLNQLVGAAISLPHCQADASISQATVKAKQEALQLHAVLDAAGQSAAAGDQAAVIAALAPVLLCCTDKEQQMMQLDEQQWLRGMHMLLSAATASGRLDPALRCHLRLLNALLPAVPPRLLPLAQGREDAADREAAAVLHAAAEELMARREAAGVLDAAAAFLQRHRTALVLPPAARSSGGSAEQQERQEHPVVLHAMERAMFAEVQQQAVIAVASCAASLAAAGPAAAESALNLKVNAKRCAMVDAATTLLLLDSLAAGRHREEPAAVAGSSGSTGVLQAVERAQDVAWHLCEALGTVQALMDRRGRFVQACTGELQALLKQLDVLGASSAPAQAEDAPDAAELRQQLTGGVQHCLLWLFGLELPGLDKQEEWGGVFHAKGGSEAAARQLATPEEVARVWPLVEPFLLQDIEHVTKYKGFLQAAAEHFRELPAAAAARSAAAWRQLAAAEPPHMPCSSLDGTHPDAMQRLLELASQAPPLQPVEGQDEIAAALMAVDGQQSAASPDGENKAQLAAVRRSLYFLLSELQDKERIRVDDLLGSDAEAAVERHVQAAKADLCFNPQRSATWEKLAHDYHGAADDLLDAASKAITHRQWRHDRELRHRVRLWRRLAYWATAGAWLCATSEDDRTRLLAGSGWRLLQDVLRTLPCQDPLASNAAWQEVKASRAYREGCCLAEAAFDAAAAALEEQDEVAGWDLLVAKARCLRKQQQQPVNWLPLLARACHYASSDDGGMLYPLYALHASRMRLLLAMPSAARWAGNGGGRRRGGEREQQGSEQERELLQLVGSYCFLPASHTCLNSPSQQARRPTAAAADEELKEDWRGLLEDCCAAMRWCLDKDRTYHRAAYRLAVAMQHLGQPHKAVALLEPFFARGKQIFTVNMTPILESKVDAAPRRGRRARQPGDGDQQQQQQQQQQQHGQHLEQHLGREGEQAGRAAGPECNWGEAPARLTGIGFLEDEATFETRLRKTLRLYFSCLADAALAAVDGQAPADCEAGRQPPLEVLQQAAAYIASMPPSANKAWEGCDKLARGCFLLSLVACLQACCPLDQLSSLGPPAVTPGLAPATVVGASGADSREGDGSHAQQHPAGHQTPGTTLGAAYAAGPLSAAPASAVQATPAEASGAACSLWPTPATQARHQVSEQLLQVAAGLDGTPAEQLLAKAHQVFSDFSLHAEGDDKWHSVAGPAVQEAVSTSSSSLAGDDELRQRCSQPNLRKMFHLYALLYVHLLQHQEATEKLLALLLAMKKRVKGLSSAEPRQARFLRRQALMLSEALLGAMESALAKVEQDVAAGALSPSQPAAQDAAAMDADGQPAGGPSGQAQQEQHPQGESPAPAGGAAEQQSPATQAQQPALLTPGGAVAAAAPPGTTPGTDLRAVLGSPALLPSAEQEQLLERCMSLLQAAHTFQRDLSRWLQMAGAAAAGSGAAAREEMRALGSIGENVLLRAYRLYVRCLGQPTMAELSRQSRAEQLKAAEEAAKQQRRQSRQQGAAARQQQLQQQGGTSTGAAGALPSIAEAGDEQAATLAGRKRGAPAPSEAAPQSTRKRLRSVSVAPQQQAAQQDGPEEEAAAAVVHQVVSQALEAAVATAQAAEET